MDKRKKVVIIFTLTMLALVIAKTMCVAQMQYYQRVNQKTYLGVDASFGTRSNRYYSDLDYIKGINDMELGGSVGILFGKKWFQSKIKLGQFKSSNLSSMEKTLKTSTQELAINIFPLAFLPGKQSFLDFYTVLGIDRSSTMFSGTYTPPAPSQDNGSGSSCSCTCPNSAPTPPPPA